MSTKSKGHRRGRVYLHRGTWWTDFGHRNERHRESAPEAKSEREAWDTLEARRAAVLEGRRPAAEGDSFASIAARFRQHCEAKDLTPKTRARWKGILKHHLEPFFGSDPAREARERVDLYVVGRRGEGAKPATVRLELGVLATAFRVAKLPRLDLPTIEVRNVRRGFFEAAEVRAVTEHLPEALRAPVMFAYFTGWRRGETLGLEWKNVDFKVGILRLEPGTTKSGDGRVLPFDVLPELARLLQEQRELTTVLERSTGQIVRHVFHRDGCPILDMDDAWRTACRAAGLPGRLFHDLRRSAARNLRRLGLSESDIMEACGWATRAMFQRYAIRDEKGLRDRLRRAVNGTTTAPTAFREASESLK